MISLDEAKGIMANSLDSFLDKHENINLLQVKNNTKHFLHRKRKN